MSEQNPLHLLHTAWGQAKASPEYNKEVFKDLQTILEDHETECEELRGLVEEKDSQIVGWQVLHDRMTKQRDELQEQLATQKSYAGDLLLDKLAAEKERDRWRGDVEHLTAEWTITKTELVQANQERRELEDKVAELTEERDRLLHGDRCAMKSALEELPDDPGISCPQEAIVILGSQRDNAQAERDALQERLREVERERRIGDEQIVRVAKERDTAVQEAHESARQEVKASKCLKECCLQAKLILDTRDRIVIAGCAQRIVNLGEPASKGDE